MNASDEELVRRIHRDLHGDHDEEPGPDPEACKRNPVPAHIVVPEPC